MHVVDLTTHSDFSSYYPIRRRILPVVDRLPEIGEFVSLQSDHGVVHAFERVGWSNDGSRELYQITLYDQKSEIEFTTYFVKNLEVYYIALPEYTDAIYGSGEVVCVDIAEIERMADELDMDFNEVFNKFIEASDSDIAQHGVRKRI